MIDKPIIMFYDLETTGVNHMKHCIIQISAILTQGGSEIDRFEFKVKPHEKAQIDSEALRANNLTESEIMRYVDQDVAFKKFRARLHEHVDVYDKRDKIILAGYNNSKFDDQFLRMFFTLNGDNYFGSFFHTGSIDVMALAAFVLQDVRYRMPNFKLHTVANFLGIDVDLDRLHDANYDVHITRKIYNKLINSKMKIQRDL